RYNGATKRRVISSHGGNYIFGHHGGQTGRYHFDGWIDSANVGGLEDFHVFIARHEGKDINSNPRGWTWTDGVQGANGHNGSNNDWYMPQHLTFGAQGSATQESSTCQVAEFVMFYGEISETDRLKAEAYLAHKYGVGLPSGHVYENGLPYQGEYNHVFFAGVPNTYQVEATNGPETYAEDGALAARGLTLDTATGIVSGVPNALGDFHVTITVSNSSGDVSKDFFFSVNKGTRVLDWSQTLPALTYGDDPITMTATSVGAGDITYTSSDTSVLEVSGSTVTIKGAGTADLTANAPATALTNAATPIVKNVTVAKANILIKANDASRLVGQANPSFTYQASGFVNSDNASVITTAPTLTPTDNQKDDCILDQNFSDKPGNPLFRCVLRSRNVLHQSGWLRQPECGLR
ncbi:MAG: hypothetical protein EB168_09010, partial [Euryarchaeota archaeon]|nr:hypothetical protein [Euryarchaeota archaeon]